MKKHLLLLFALFGGLSAFGQYCSPSYSSACTSGDYINSVVFNTISNTGTGCTTPGSNYQDYTALSTNVQQGTTYPISVTPGPTWGQSFAVWFDFNHDNDFDDAGEFFDIGYAGGGVTLTVPIAIPTGVPGGPTRMRVVCKYATPTLTSTESCYSGSFGETEDYTVNISAPLNDDAGISAFVTPTLPTCNFNDSIRVSLYNYGTDTLTSATIFLSLNAGVPTTTSWTGSIPPFGADTVNLGLFPLTSGMSLTAYTQLPNGVVEDPMGSWNDSSVIASLSSGLSGIYTIGAGATTPDYADISSAVSDLTTFGVCGPVIFDIRDGVYTEQMDLPALTSMSPTNTVTFRSENGDASLVTITTAGSTTANNYVVKMNGVNNFSFENLTLENTGTNYSTVFAMNNSSMNNVIGCNLTAGALTSTSTNAAIIYSNNGIDSNNVFMNNTFTNGAYAMYWFGTNTTTFEKGNVIEGNTFNNQYYRGLMIYYNDGIKVNNNTFNGTSSYTSKYCLYYYYVVGASEVMGNNIKGQGANGWLYGIYWSQGGGSNANHVKFENNMFQVGWNGSTSTLYGVYLTGVGYVDLYHNSILASAGGTGTRALYLTSGGGIDVQNNIIANYSGGHAFYLGSVFTISNSDYNVLYSPAGNVGYFNGNQQTLGDWQTVSSFDGNSIDYNPSFYSDNDLHVCSDSIANQGTPMASITMDMDGHLRSMTPDMGADEYSGINGSFLGNDVQLCTGDSVQLVAGSPTDTILWSTGATTSAIWVSTPGSYSVTVNSACGTGADAVVVTPSALNYAGYMATSSVEFCNGDSVLLTSTQMADTYTWSDGSTNDSLWVTAGGTYTLTISDACGSGTEALTVTMNDVPTASFTTFENNLTSVFTNTSVSGGTSTYAWDFGDGTTSNQMNPTHLFTNSGAHYVTLTVTNGCGSTTFGDTIVLSVIGLKEIADFGSVNVHPNPSTGVFTLDLEVNDAMNVELIVTNVMGQVVSTKAISATNGVNSEQIDLSNEAAGVYYMSIRSNNNELINKMLIKK